MPCTQRKNGEFNLSLSLIFFVRCGKEGCIKEAHPERQNLPIYGKCLCPLFSLCLSIHTCVLKYI